MQVLDLLYSNMRLVPFPLEQVQMIYSNSFYDFDFLLCVQEILGVDDDVARLGLFCAQEISLNNNILRY